MFRGTSFSDRALSSCGQADMVNNLDDGLAWGLLPIFFAHAGLSVSCIGVLAALYRAVWGLGQVITGGLSDRIGRKPLIVAAMLTQAAAIGWIAATRCDLGRRRAHRAVRARGGRADVRDAPAGAVLNEA